MPPVVQVSSRSTDGELGTALLMIGLGALVSMRLTGHLVDRLGTGVLPVVTAVFAVVSALPTFASSPGPGSRTGVVDDCPVSGVLGRLGHPLAPVLASLQ